ncbi:hypothetical protein [Brachybacterium sp. FME24]|uniref:hypothetical protein n=1 Tax=Brachybacterium sp. FME24 TaxID=2742605 RepID=UPI001D029977|nr:hypothetical protein [Brachybacterium sp. FME24]
MPLELDLVTGPQDLVAVPQDLVTMPQDLVTMPQDLVAGPQERPPQRPVHSARSPSGPS